MRSVLNVHRSILGQPWRWRGLEGDVCDDGFVADDLVTRILLARGCPREGLAAHKAPSIREFMPDPSIFRDMDRAAERLADAVMAKESVAIFGDYDVDGATSSALLVRLLRDLGLAARPYIPDRQLEGYGPNAPAMLRLAGEGATLIVTVDCGAQAFDALAATRDAGVDVLVVDHHQCTTQLPPALAVVNPNRLDEGEGAAHGHLAAVGVAFLLAAALVRTLRARGFFAGRAEPKLLDLLDLVALGTVADVAQLRGLNRAFVAQGLKVMARRQNIGLAALIEASRLTRAPTCTDLGFALGPRINAGGRVGKSDLGVRLLTTQDPEEARALAVELDRLNEERRVIEGDVQAQADLSARAQDSRGCVVVSGRGWHPGVIGIVAGRLKEKLGRPVLVIAIDDHGVGKGSGRSIPGVDMGATILAAKELGLVSAGGGHAAAAGVTVAEYAIPALADFLHTRMAEPVERAREDRALLVDAVLAPGGVSPLLIEALEAGGPYGMGWPAPRVAAGPVRIVKADVVGNGHVRAILTGDDGRRFKGVAFRQAETELGMALLGAPPHRKLWLAGRAKLDDWGSRPAAELHIDDMAWAD
ncbi:MULTISPECIES: single-stranded-DNA-specific exonuclease RecJ [Sphingomonas]|jgi:single-stranded-DNA-specific exonuclease|uniref:Single-stranded-DNA-specific exonuclease RecJ n=1 Tax=Sphingomonas hankookensis TaxID=563996 RepID=A0ABR5YH76_9SPHN|nr:MULTISPECIES: single-stranded-DNA-specific exonuclease RecJ [Sphingomonas]KZE18593.1 single-stranded-DNA-specific exonuclease RecJ [Sphingomonas hankookensis]PZT94973.1 MAG: single-stranded-DNA-specific exonuclease RecJ [Sphingomonas sp.]RSV33704.1 single-stranded-DNA-specific exonuclease RecJ [Sphingomonas sp. ABOLH]WCP70476.1 single-stranded-DNA-specific exonuclease RecJ [Sphingomonas hankookensis]